VRANEIEIARLEGWYRVVGVDTGLRGIVRRVVPQRIGKNMPTAGFLDWAGVEAFTGHLPSVRLRVPHPKLARLHPAQLADLVEAASHNEAARSCAPSATTGSSRRTCSRSSIRSTGASSPTSGPTTRWRS